jgi:transposase
LQVTQAELFEFLQKKIPRDKLLHASREDLIEFIRLQQEVTEKMEKEVHRLRALNGELQQRSMFVNEQLIVLKNKFFGKSSERVPVKGGAGDSSRSQGPKLKRVLLPSERYPDAPLIERRVEFQEIPGCKCCGAQMSDSGMTEDSEFLTVIPAQYLVIRQMRQKVRCTKCHGDFKTALAPSRIKEGSAYSDEMMVDVAMTKYCDIIPIERYSAMAGREGLEGLPPHSLIESTHYLADFVNGAYVGLREEIARAKVLHADETPHRMLEGDKKSSWYLWGFSTPTTSYYECHGTRSGDVASGLLKSSGCEFLVSDVFSGYGKAVKDVNEFRREQDRPQILSVFCNAHARRKFKEAQDAFPADSQFFIERYQAIYHLEALAKEKPPDRAQEIRDKMQIEFEAIKKKCLEELSSYSQKSSMARAMTYFLQNYEGLTRFLEKPELPIDNNPQERLMRNPVIGRKTWYGTHSKRGAKTAAILFSLVESCKLNNINPRKYFAELVKDLHAGKAPYTPKTFADTLKN